MANRDFQCTLESRQPRRSKLASAAGLLQGCRGLGTCLGLILVGLVLGPPAFAAASPEPAESRLGNLETRLAWQADPAIDPPQTPEAPTPDSQPAVPQDTTTEAIAPPAADSPAPETETPPATSTSPTNASHPGVPIPPDANALAWRREILAVSLLGVMGVGCTIAAFFAVWILSKNLRPSDS